MCESRHARPARPDEEPYGDRLPVSTAQILHADLYTARVLPERISFGPDPGDTLIYDDDYGEFLKKIMSNVPGVRWNETSASPSCISTRPATPARRRNAFARVRFFGSESVQ